MVTAGIYMVVRSNVLFLLTPQTLEFIAVIGAATALFAATIGVAQNDIKKVLAYSTVSQLGYMFLALGVGAFSSSVFHVATHAFFKALLFLGAGSVIHAMSNEQNMAFMGGLRGKLPITFITMLVGTIAIAGIPPFSGFFSKDEILAHAFEHNIVLWGVGLIAAGFTSFYMFRLLFLTFFGEFRGTEDQRHHLHESPATMTIPLIVLAILAAVGGMMSLPEVFGFESALGAWLKPVLAPGLELAGEAHHLDHNTEYLLMGVSVAVALAGAGIASALYLKRKTAEEVNKAPQGILSLWANKYYVDEAYDVLFVKPTLAASKFYHDFVERWVIDGAVRLIGRAPWATGQGIKFSQTGTIAFYVAAMVVGVLLLFTYQLILPTL
jgi:NADH-quinone oxidoreductase subunit L